VEGITRLLFSDIHEPINIGNPNEISILEFATTINGLLGKKSQLLYKIEERLESDPQRRRPDISRAREWLGWEPKVTLQDGIIATIPYFKDKLGIQ